MWAGTSCGNSPVQLQGWIACALPIQCPFLSEAVVIWWEDIMPCYLYPQIFLLVCPQIFLLVCPLLLLFPTCESKEPAQKVSERCNECNTWAKSAWCWQSDHLAISTSFLILRFPAPCLECCVPPMAVLVLPQLREDGAREAVWHNPSLEPAFPLSHWHHWFLLVNLPWCGFTSLLGNCRSQTKEDKVRPWFCSKLVSKFPVSHFSFIHSFSRLLVSLRRFPLDILELSSKVCWYC